MLGRDKSHGRQPMTRTFRIAALTLVAVSAGGLAYAQSTAPAPQAGGRFAMQPADGGALRLDTETGTMSLCKPQAGGQWACQSLPDERAALDKEIARLAQENRDLQGAVKRLEAMNGIPGDGGPRGQPGRSLPGPQDVDKAMDYLHSMLKKFKEKLKEFEDLDPKRGEKI